MTTGVDLLSLTFSAEAPGIEDPRWQESAVCAQVDLDAMFPGAGVDYNGDEERLHAVGEARAICAVCPVRRDCLIDALHIEQQLASPSFDAWGMRAGITQGQRRKLYRAAAEEDRLVTIDEFPEVQNG